MVTGWRETVCWSVKRMAWVCMSILNVDEVPIFLLLKMGASSKEKRAKVILGFSP
jgi:hypothetical protein